MSHVPVGRLAGKVALMAGASRGIGAAIANAVVARMRAVLPAISIAQSNRSQPRSSLSIGCGKIGRSNLWPLRLCTTILPMIAFNPSAFAVEPTWKDGMMFTQEDLASLQGHKAVKIVFGLEPGKCTGELTAVSEWLKMTQGTLVQTYSGRGDVQRVAGDEWFQENGTKVTLCNKSGANAMLIGVQFKPE
jgi:hypothetical protein